MASSVDMANEVVAVLNTIGGFTAKRALVPQYSLEDVQELVVDVIIWSLEQAKATRSWQAEKDHGILVYVQAPLTQEDIAGGDALIDLTETMENTLKAAPNYGNGLLNAIERAPYYDHELFSTTNQFVLPILLIIREVG